MDVTFAIKRYNPEDTAAAYLQEYRLDVEPSSMVLDALIKIREEVDGTLALRCSCRSAICGSCAMRVNGKASLACNTKISDVVGVSPVLVEPVGNMDVVKDLVVDFGLFWDKIREVQPWLQTSEVAPDGEYLASDDDMIHLAGVMACIMCGACVSDCTVLEVDKHFLGPAALAKAYRFVGDPRDDADDSRLEQLNKYGGVWDCTRCMQCVEVCPKDVDPMSRIMSLRDKTMDAGYTGTYGARHATAFSELVKKNGRLDELRLPIKTFGLFNLKEMLKLLPVGLKAQRVGKRPPIFHKAIPGVRNIRRIFEKLERKK